MAYKRFTLSPDFSIPAVDYAGQGNAILGIRDAGKTYTAMKAAEQLLDNGIPIICYDPVGVWKNLKIGSGKHKGYPVVVAGGEGSDIRITTSNAVDVVRAAMKENVSLVIDLYSPELINKSTWIKIVQETVDLLMYENKPCGLRHIFIEEAAEFVPQRLQPQHSRVYASLERLARMGRNARLGYTLINQRAEEVNKAILEISAMSLLHKQVGKNSLKSIQQWMELLQVENTKDIIQSLPGLGQGQCWVIGMSSKPQLIQVAPRNTFHPDPKNNAINLKLVDSLKMDVSAFVTRLNKLLVKPAPAEKPTPAGKESDEVAKLKEQIQLHAKNYDKLHFINDQLRTQLQSYQKREEDLLAILQKKPVVAHFDPVKTPVKPQSVPERSTSAPVEKLFKCPLAILRFLATYPDRAFSKAQVGIATSYSPNSGSFSNAISELFTRGLVKKVKDRLQVKDIPNLKDWTGELQTEPYSIHTYLSKLAKCEREIYQVLLDHPDQAFTKQDLAATTESQYAFASGSFSNAISTLNTLELIRKENGMIRLNPELLEI